MKIILIGYNGSQCIVPASKYLTSKYLPKAWSYFYLNYTGNIQGWSKYISTFLSYLDDRYVIFALDDYLVAAEIDYAVFANAWHDMDEDIVCAKLCNSTPEEHEEYPVTTQYCLWNREFLIWLLGQVSQPWEFEIRGSQIFKTQDKKVIHRPCLEYFTNSSISRRWEGVRLDGLTEEDIKYIKENNLIV